MAVPPSFPWHQYYWTLEDLSNAHVRCLKSRCSSFMRRVYKWWCDESKHVQGSTTWDHLEHVDLECLQICFINCPPRLGHHEIPTLQCWVLAFDFQQKLRTQDQGVLCWVEKTPSLFSVTLKFFFALRKTKKKCFSLSKVAFFKFLVLKNVLIVLIYLNTNTFWEVFIFKWTQCYIKLLVVS